MKKYFFFITSFAGALLVFLLISATVFFLSVNQRNPKNEQLLSKSEANQSTTDSGKPHCIVAVFQSDSDVYISVVDIYPNLITSTEMDSATPYGGKALSQILSNEGFYPFTFACKQRVSGRQTINFIKFTPESFKIIADTEAELVYNNEENEKVLVTSVQALKLMDSQLFSQFALQTVSGMVGDSSLTAFNLVTNCCENDFSYPNMYILFNERN